MGARANAHLHGADIVKISTVGGKNTEVPHLSGSDICALWVSTKISFTPVRTPKQ